jgi:hypothetical protein
LFQLGVPVGRNVFQQKGRCAVGEFPKDGGPVFPVRSWGDGCLSGISVRDYYAAAALTGLVSVRELSFGELPKADELANRCFQIADAMLKERTVDHG